MSINPVPFTSKRMVLRPLRLEDKEAYIDMYKASDESFAPWTPALNEAQSYEDRFALALKTTIEGHQKASNLRLTAFLPSGEMVGQFNANNINRGVFQNAYLGWAVNVRFQGQGFATEGVTALIETCFKTSPQGIDLHRVQANIIPSNLASRRVAEKVGMREEGYAEAYLKIAGKWQDHVMYAKTNSSMEKR